MKDFKYGECVHGNNLANCYECNERFKINNELKIKTDRTVWLLELQNEGYITRDCIDKLMFNYLDGKSEIKFTLDANKAFQLKTNVAAANFHTFLRWHGIYNNPDLKITEHEFISLPNTVESKKPLTGERIKELITEIISSARQPKRKIADGEDELTGRVIHQHKTEDELLSEFIPKILSEMTSLPESKNVPSEWNWDDGGASSIEAKAIIKKADERLEYANTRIQELEEKLKEAYATTNEVSKLMKKR